MHAHTIPDKHPSHPNGFERQPSDFAYPCLKLPLWIIPVLHNITTTWQHKSCFPRPLVPGLPAVWNTSSDHTLFFSTFFGLALSVQTWASTSVCYMGVSCPCQSSYQPQHDRWQLFPVSESSATSHTIPLLNLESCFVVIWFYTSTCRLRAVTGITALRLHDTFPVQTSGQGNPQELFTVNISHRLNSTKCSPAFSSVTWQQRSMLKNHYMEWDISLKIYPGDILYLQLKIYAKYTSQVWVSAKWILINWGKKWATEEFFSA